MKCVYIILTLIVSLPFLVQAAEITDGLVLYTPLDEGSGKEIEDLSNTKAKGELAEVQEDVTEAISSHLDTGIMSGEEFDLWNLMLKAQSALQATRARILVEPSLLTEPTVASKEVESASAWLVEDLGIVETNTQAISTYLK